MDINDSASLEARAERRDNEKNSSTSLSERLSVENQSGEIGKKYFASSVLVALEINGSADKNEDSAEPTYQLSNKISHPKGVVVHNDAPGENAQKLAAGGQIRQSGKKTELVFSGQDKVIIDTTGGAADILSNDAYQKEVRYKGSTWQQTVFSSENDRRITFGINGISSIENKGIMELFPGGIPSDNGSEPANISSTELTAIFSSHGRHDLSKALNKIDNAEGAAHSPFLNSNGAESSIVALSKALKDRAELVEKAAILEPSNASSFNVSAENQLRIALQNMREQFGAGTPESKEFAQALKVRLSGNQDKEQEEEIDRLAFEIRRAGLMETVIASIEKGLNGSGTLAADETQAVRQALICMHILSGDEGLASFVKDTNLRTSNYDLQAPIAEGGPFHHGAIMMTPDGSTSYTGAFRLVQQ
ncbi:MAG: hypothetical protein K2X81_13010 [Candidatus Obscuribacterales bacterium]|nr:hypothetical protein [Candidatus Obscuribacterales bacterium]